MTDNTQRVKARVLAILETDAGILSLVPASRVYPMETPPKPVYPFMRFDRPESTPYEDNCGAGSSVLFRIRVFGSEYHCGLIAPMVSSLLHDTSVFYSCKWIRTQYMPDASEIDVWTAMVDFEVVDK